MDVVYHLLVACHMLGLAALVGGYLVSALARPAAVPAGAAADGPVGTVSSGTGPVVSQVMLWGARAQLVTGLLLVGVAEGVLDDVELSKAKIGVKLVVALVVAACAEIAAARQRRGEQAPAALVHGAGMLAIVNVLVATLWY